MPELQSSELSRLFDVCQRIEMAHARLYRTLSQAHAADPKIAALWRKTADEEEGHAAQFRLASNYAASVASVAIDLDQAQQMLHSVEYMARRLQSHPPGVAEALRLTIGMEEAMEKLHMDQLVRFDRSAHQKLFKAMMGADRAHVQSLREALAQVEAQAGPAR